MKIQEERKRIVRGKWRKRKRKKRRRTEGRTIRTTQTVLSELIDLLCQRARDLGQAAGRGGSVAALVNSCYACQPPGLGTADAHITWWWWWSCCSVARQ